MLAVIHPHTLSALVDFVEPWGYPPQVRMMVVASVMVNVIDHSEYVWSGIVHKRFRNEAMYNRTLTIHISAPRNVPMGYYARCESH